MDAKISALSGAMSGALGAFVVAPLDVVKARLQVQSNDTPATETNSINKKSKTTKIVSNPSSLRYSGVFNSLRTILRQEGVPGFFRGLPPTMLGYVISYSCYFSCYDGLKSTFTTMLASDNVYIENQSPTMTATVLAAIGAGSFSNLCTNPLWVIRTRLQVQDHVNLSAAVNSHGSKTMYKGTRHAFVTIFREEGPTAFYKGLSASMLGLSHVAIQFPMYEYLKDTLSGGDRENLSTVNLIVASSVSKVIATGLTYPHEVARARLHVNKVGHILDSTSNNKQLIQMPKVIRILKYLVQNEGIGSIYRGLGTQLIRVTPACAVTFTSYECLVKGFKKHIVHN